MSYNTIHETVVQDIVTIMKDGIDSADTVFNPSGAPSSLARAGSLSKATSGLTLVFPTLVDSGLPIETASMITKAVERKAVSLLQIAFSAFNITNSKDAFEFVKSFHTNIQSGKMTMDEFIDAMDSLAEQVKMPLEDKRKYAAVMEDLKRNCNYYFDSDISESSVNQYKVLNRGMRPVVVKEDWKYSGSKNNKQNQDDRAKQSKKDLDDGRDEEKYGWDREKHDWDKNRYNMDDPKSVYDREKDDKEFQQKQARNDVMNQKDNIEMLKNQLLPSDIKKANEMVPSMMIVNFVTTDEKTSSNISRQMIIGVKARMIPVDPEDVANKLISKHADSNILLKFIKASTREISFVKDFLLAIDNAKLGAIANSKKGSPTYKYLKVLERRALLGKVRKTLKLNNAYKAISTLVVSKETAEYIRRYNNIDITLPSTIRPLMEKLNLMMFIIADESEESASIIMDTGDDSYEVISYTHLEREASDGSYKKAINLMTKVVR